MITFLAQVTAYRRHDNALFLLLSLIVHGAAEVWSSPCWVKILFSVASLASDLGVILDKLLLNRNGVRV